MSFFKNPFGSRVEVLRSPLAPEECAAKLKDYLEEVTRPLTGGTRGLRGRITDQGFTLGRHTFRGQVSTRAQGTFSRDAEGTRIDVRLSPSLGSRVWFSLAFAMFAAFGFAALDIHLDPKAAFHVHVDWSQLPMAIILFGLPFLAYALGRWLGRRHGPYLIECLCEALNAETAPELRTIE